MNTQHLNQRIFSALFLGFLAVLMFYSFKPTTPKHGVANLEYLFQNFEGTKSMEKIVASDMEYPKSLLDSLNSQVQLLAGQDQVDQSAYGATMQKRDLLQRQIDVELSKLNQEYTQKIWEQINAYVSEFAVREELEFLYGTNGNGNIMYAADHNDLTAEILSFINNRYHGN